MMRKQKSLLTRIGDAVEVAKDKTQEVGASLMKKAEVRPPTRGAKWERRAPWSRGKRGPRRPA